jgi:hypothetical protein
MSKRAFQRMAAICAVAAIATVCVGGAQAKVRTPKNAEPSPTRVLVHASKSKVGKTARAKFVAFALVTKTPNDAPDFDYRARIEQAQALLRAQPVLNDDMKIDGKGNLSHFTWLLAVGKKSGPLTILKMDEAGKNAQGFTVTWPVDNFINTHFQVKAPDGYIVFAQRRPVHAKVGYQEAVYTAYSPELDTKTMRSAGMEYLRLLEGQAYDRIKSHDVRSLVAPNATIADKIPQNMVLRLMITEHIDPLHMKYVGMEQCIHEVLFTLAANQGNSYAYAKSSAGALGLPQFVRSTYDMVRKNYPEAQLEPDFELGMRNLGNAVFASVLLMDLELTPLPPAYLKRFMNSSQQFAAFLAAGYNRNPHHVLQTYNKTHSFTGGNAPAENKMYVRIQDWVGSFLKKEYGLG